MDEEYYSDEDIDEIERGENYEDKFPLEDLWE